MSEYLIKTISKQDRIEVKSQIKHLGDVVENWPDGSFNFSPSDEVSEDEMVQILDDFKVESKLI